MGLLSPTASMQLVAQCFEVPGVQAMEADMGPGALAEEIAAAQETVDRLAATIKDESSRQSAC